MSSTFLSLTAALLCCLVISGSGKVVKSRRAFALANTYGSGMVLQRDRAPIIWGYGEPGRPVEVVIGTVNVTTYVRAEGIWEAIFPKIPVGGPFELTAIQNPQGQAETIKLNDVWIGDVWVCSGQSNMEFDMSSIYNSSEEIADAATYDKIRIFRTFWSMSETPLDELAQIDIPWSLTSDESMSRFSALCFLFARRLYDELKVPIGLIQSTWGGSLVEAWSPQDAFVHCGSSAKNSKTSPRIDMSDDSVIYNAMIHPLTKTPINGVIWYQGETNARGDDVDSYSCRFPAMIEEWRVKWFDRTSGNTKAEFPFGFVQLASDANSTTKAWSELRWHQTADYGYAPNHRMPNTFMAVAMDLPDNDSPFGPNHPRDKKTIAYRLSLAASRTAYNNYNNPTNGPIVSTITREVEDLLVVTYGSPIQIRSNDGFEVTCGTEWLDIRINSVDLVNNTVTLDISPCPTATRLAYAWKVIPCPYKNCAVYSDDEFELPAAPWIWDL